MSAIGVKHYGSDPATFADTVAPSDTSNLNNVSRALYIGTGGNVAVEMAGSAANATFTNVPDGTQLPIMVNKVLATGTTATDILNLY